LVDIEDNGLNIWRELKKNDSL